MSTGDQDIRRSRDMEISRTRYLEMRLFRDIGYQLQATDTGYQP